MLYMLAHIYLICYYEIKQNRERSISCIRIGDRVMWEDGKMPMVQNIYRGRETTYYEIKAFDYAPVKVTVDAVFMTNNGVKSVKELNFDDAS